MESEGRAGQSTYWLSSLREALGRCESSPGYLGGGGSGGVHGRGGGCSSPAVDRESAHHFHTADTKSACRSSDVALSAATAPPGPGTEEQSSLRRASNGPDLGPGTPTVFRAEGKHRDDEFLRVGAGGRRQRLRSQIGRL